MSTAQAEQSELDTTYFSVSAVEHIAKQVIRAALPGDRQAMWDAYLRTVQAAAEASPHRMPWDAPETITRLTARKARDVLTAVLLSVPDDAEQARLAKITAREAEKAERRMEDGTQDPSVPAGKYPAQCCANARCGRQFRPRGPAAKFCSPACRVAAFKQRQAAKAR